jgi:BirA family biotin operon repressor/biotin-[acetyl-CoA-carboxylase] ligase
MPEVAVASADEQTAGRGRAGRSWLAPPGSSLLVSAGFRPTYLAPEATWMVGAAAGLAMAEAAEWAASLAPGTIGLKWPNDLAVETSDGLRKLGGVLGETIGLGTPDVRAVVGIGLNVDWTGLALPADLAGSMTSLRVVAGRAISIDDVATAYLERLAAVTMTLRAGTFDVAGWSARQATTGRAVVIEMPGGDRRRGTARGVDAASGALLVDGVGGGPEPTAIHAADVIHVRLAGTGV